MTRFLLLIFISSAWLFTYGQTAHYKITVAGFEVGTQTVKRFEKDNITTYEVNSDVLISMIFKYRVTFDQLTRFQDGKLLDSKVTITKNGKIQNASTTRWAGNHYEIMCDGKQSQLHQEINYSGSIVYFNEPKPKTREIYGETPCHFKTIEKTGTHIYESTDPESGLVNEFFYKNGILQKAIVHHPLINFVTELTSYSP